MPKGKPLGNTWVHADEFKEYCRLMDEVSALMRARKYPQAQHAYDIAKQYAAGGKKDGRNYHNEWKKLRQSKGTSASGKPTKWITVKGNKVPIGGK